jgi:hypothetical protein
LIKFGTQQYTEKRPVKVEIRASKSETSYKKGVDPKLIIKTLKEVRYVVMVDFREEIRIYFFNASGVMMGAENFEPTNKFMSDLHDHTRLIYKMP